MKRDFDGDTHGEFDRKDRAQLRIVRDTIYRARRFQVNYTTYDVRRDQDSLKSSKPCTVMVHSPDTSAHAHPFWYAQVLGIFHANVFHTDPTVRRLSPQRMEFLWVRWLGDEPGYKSGFKYAKLPKVGFVPEDDEYAFGFLDPAHVIRGAHLIPAFHSGKTNDLLRTREKTAARLEGTTDDWVNFYVNM